MKSFIVFTISDNRYAIDLSVTKRIIQATKLKRVPNSSSFIDGLLSFDNSVIKVLNLRTALKIEQFENEMRKNLDGTKQYHINFFHSVEETVKSRNSFPHELDPNLCSVGQFIASFNIPDVVNDSFKEFKYIHSKFHNVSSSILEEKDSKFALERIEAELKPLFETLLNRFEEFRGDIGDISNSMQKYIIYEDQRKRFAIKVDSILDIVNIDSINIKDGDSRTLINDRVVIRGVFESAEKLVTIIEDFEIKELN
jgi:chemotaxis signal transduction protein